jgi:predicted PurR-regulated permease PerM
VLFGAAGAFFGVETSVTLVGKMVFGGLYGFVGMCAGVPLAVALNVTRHWR